MEKQKVQPDVKGMIRRHYFDGMLADSPKADRSDEVALRFEVESRAGYVAKGNYSLQQLDIESW